EPTPCAVAVRTTHTDTAATRRTLSSKREMAIATSYSGFANLGVAFVSLSSNFRRSECLIQIFFPGAVGADRRSVLLDRGRELGGNGPPGKGRPGTEGNERFYVLTICGISVPYTSVSRMSRPLNR